VGLLPLRRDAGRISLRRARDRRRAPRRQGRREGGRVRGLRLRKASGQGLEPRALPLRRAGRRHPGGGGGEHRADLPGELREPRHARHHRFLGGGEDPPRRGDPAGDLHERRGPDPEGRGGARRTPGLRRGSPPGRRPGPRHRDRIRPAHDAGGEDPGPPLGPGRLPRRCGGAGGEAGGHGVRPRRHPVQPRVRDAHGLHLLGGLRRRGHPDRRPGERLLLPRSPGLPGRCDHRGEEGEASTR